MRVPAHVSLDGARGVSRTRAGLGSGLEVVIPTGSWMKDEIWVNVPVVEPFARHSPYVLTAVRTTATRSSTRARTSPIQSVCHPSPRGTAARRRATYR